MDCGESRELLQDELDGRLDAAAAARLAEHVAGCAACAEEKRGLASLRAVFRATPRPAAPAGFKSGVMSALPAGRVRRLPRVLGILVAAAAVVVVGVTLIHDARKHASAEREVAATSAPAPRAHLADEADKEAKAGADVNETTIPDADSVDVKPPAADARGADDAARPAKPAAPAPAPATPAAAQEKAAGKKSVDAPKPAVRYVVFRDAAAAERFAKTLASDDAWKQKDKGPAPGLVAGAPSTGGGGGRGGGAAPADAGYEARRDAAVDLAKEAANSTRRIVARTTVAAADADAALTAHVAEAGGALVPAADTSKFAAVVEPPAPKADATKAETAPEAKSKSAENVRREVERNPVGATKAAAEKRVVVVIVVLETPK